MDAYEIKQYRRGKLIHIRLSPRTHQRLKIRVAELETTLQRFVSRTVRRALLPPKGKKHKPTRVKGGPVRPQAAQVAPIKLQVAAQPVPKAEETKKAPTASEKPAVETKTKWVWKGKRN